MKKRRKRGRPKGSKTNKLSVKHSFNFDRNKLKEALQASRNLSIEEALRLVEPEARKS